MGIFIDLCSDDGIDKMVWEHIIYLVSCLTFFRLFSSIAYA